jgi:hypothetical protein
LASFFKKEPAPHFEKNRKTFFLEVPGHLRGLPDRGSTAGSRGMRHIARSETNRPAAHCRLATVARNTPERHETDVPAATVCCTS